MKNNNYLSLALCLFIAACGTSKSMPPDQPLESKDLKLIEAWLQQGGNNN